VNDVVNELLKRGFFDKGIFERFSILTSRGIQRRYFKALERRKEVEAREELLLINKQDYPNIVLINSAVNISGENVYISVKNVNNSIENVDNFEQRVVKESKVNGGDSKSCESSKQPEEKPQPLLIQKIQEEEEKLGIILDKSLASKAVASGIDPTWLEGSFSFPVFVNEWLKENPKYWDKTAHEMTLLFASAFSWENLRKEYPLWKQGKKHELEEIEKLKALETARRNRPTKCECGKELEKFHGSWICRNCQIQFDFDEKALGWKWSKWFSD
jgi:hypothetical protein